jgi:hypothetical protein
MKAASLHLWALPVLLFFGATNASAVEVSLELNFLKPANQDVVLGSDTGSVPGNDVLEPDTDPGFKLTVRDTTWRASWLNIRSKTGFSSSVGRDSIALDHPDDDYGSYSTVAADGKIELDVISADYLFPIAGTGTGSLMFYTGLQYANYKSTLDANFDSGG